MPGGDTEILGLCKLERVSALIDSCVLLVKLCKMSRNF